MKTRPTMLALALSTLAFAAPTATASHVCEGDALVHEPWLQAGVFTRDCTGAFVKTPGPCHDALWGHHGDAFGVGGHDGCETLVYVRAGLVTTLLP